MWYYFTSPTVFRAKPIRERFVTKAELANIQGFRTVYAYNEETVTQLCKQQNFRGLRAVPVFADDLLLDFDNNEQAAFDFANKLLNRRLSHRLYSSGNRSIHVEVPTTPIEGASVPHTHKQFVAKHAPGADLTIYNHAALYRLAGTWHEKNPGHRKELLRQYDGFILELPLVNKPVKSIAAIKSSTNWTLLDLALKDKVAEGGRRIHVWRIATRCYDLGVDFNDALQYAMQWNITHASPVLDLHIVEQKVREAYEQRAYKDKV